MGSQFGEDKIISTYFPKSYKGICIEVGAADGLIGSNTIFFEQKGWTAICIEANMDLAKRCMKNRKVTIPCAVADYNGTSKFMVYDVNGSNETAISSLQVDNRLVEQHEGMISGVREMEVEVHTLDYILATLPLITKIDFISIDTEGTELQVLMGFDIGRWLPKLMVIENNFDDPQIEQYLAQFGYKKVRRNVVNDFYER